MKNKSMNNKIFYFLFPFFCSLLIINCDLFTGPKVDLLQVIGDEVDWANAPKLTVRIDYPPAWGVSSPSQGIITMDLRKGYEFGVEFTPEMAYTLQKWMVFRTFDLDNLTDGSWVESPELITNTSKIKPLNDDEVIISYPIEASDRNFKFTILTTNPVTLVPLCDTQPRITRTEPRNSPDGPPYSRASDIVLYFNGALNRDTVKFANTEGSDGIWITATLPNDDIQYNTRENWYSEPEYEAKSGFFTVTMYSSATLPSPNSLMTVTVKGIKNTEGKSIDEYSFSWKTSAATTVALTSYNATYKDNGTIAVSWEYEGADRVEPYYKLNNWGNNPLENAGNTAAISGVNALTTSGVTEGSSVSGIEEYTIFIELYKEGIMESRTSFKIWNFPGMVVSNDNLAVEVKTAADLAAMNNDNKLNGQYVLANDITITGAWNPVGAGGTAPFTGNFYGNGHKITFASGSSIGGGIYRGLFGYAKDAVIRDLTIEYNVPVNSPINVNAGSSIGGAAGYLENTTVSNVITLGEMTVASSGNVNLGGIVGYIDKGLITNCHAGMSVTLNSGGAGESDVGAVAGSANGGSGGTIPINIGYSYTPTPGSVTIGPNISLYNLAIDRVTVTANVSGGASGGTLSIGGAIGKSSNNTVRKIIVSGGEVSFSRTAITAETYVGGVTGSAENSSYGSLLFYGQRCR